MSRRLLSAYVVLCLVMVPVGLMVVPVLLSALGELATRAVWWAVCLMVGGVVLWRAASRPIGRRRSHPAAQNNEERRPSEDEAAL